MIIREIAERDLDGLLRLYTELHNNPIPERTDDLLKLWHSILDDPRVHIIVADDDGVIASSCVVTIIPNLTQNQKPYALVENVVTAGTHRKMGLATACLEYAKDIAEQEGCYKLMLMTGVKEDHVMRLYENAGYNREDKIGFIRWLGPKVG